MQNITNTIISFLAQALGITGYSSETPPYFGTGNYYLTNVLEQQQGLLEFFIKPFVSSFFPGIRTKAPNYMLHARYRDFEARIKQREQMASLYSYSPLAIKMASALGESLGIRGARSMFIQGGALTSLGAIWNSFYGYTMGPLLGDRFMERGRQTQLLFDSLEGLYLGRGLRLPSTGLRTYEVSNIIDTLSSKVYRDKYGLFKRGRFDISEMIDIARMGADFGLFQGIQQPEQITQRVEKLANTVSVGLSVYGALYKNMRKEQVIERLLDLTANTLPLTETATASQLMYRVDSLAKNANISIEAMHRIIADGNRVLSQVGIEGDVGTRLIGTTFNISRLMTARFGPGEGFGIQGGTILTPREAKLAGGTLGIQAAIQQRTISGLLSPRFRQGLAYYELGRQMGVPQKNLQNFMKTLTTGTLNTEDLMRMRSMIVSRYKMPGLTDIEKASLIEEKIRVNQTELNNTYLRREQNIDLIRAVVTRQYEEAVLGGTLSEPVKQKLLLRGEKFNRLKADTRAEILKIQKDYLRDYLISTKKMNENAATVDAQYMVHMWHGTGLYQKAKQQERQTLVDMLRSKLYEKVRTRGGVLERLWYNIGDKGFLTSILPESHIFNLYEENIFKDISAVKVNAAKIVRELPSIIPWLYTEESKVAYKALRNVYGERIESVRRGETVWNILRNSIKKINFDKDISLAETLQINRKHREQVEDSFVKFMKDKDINFMNFDKFIDEMHTKFKGIAHRDITDYSRYYAKMLSTLKVKDTQKYKDFLNLYKGLRATLESMAEKTGKWTDILTIEPELIRKWKYESTLTQKLYTTSKELSGIKSNSLQGVMIQADLAQKAVIHSVYEQDITAKNSLAELLGLKKEQTDLVKKNFLRFIQNKELSFLTFDEFINKSHKNLKSADIKKIKDKSLVYARMIRLARDKNLKRYKTFEKKYVNFLQAFQLWQGGAAQLTPEEQDRITSMFGLTTYTPYVNLPNAILKVVKDRAKKIDMELKAKAKEQVQDVIDVRGHLLLDAKENYLNLSEREALKIKRSFGFKDETSFRDFMQEELSRISKLKQGESTEKYIRGLSQRLIKIHKGKFTGRTITKFFEIMASEAKAEDVKELWKKFTPEMEEAKKTHGITNVVDAIKLLTNEIMKFFDKIDKTTKSIDDKLSQKAKKETLE